jgi:hypothetical protein
MKRKWLAVGIILLFVGVTIAPAIDANNNTIVSKQLSLPTGEDIVPITVLEYKADGMIGKSIVKMSGNEAEKLRIELDGTDDTSLRLSIYKKYGLIPQNVTLDNLRAGLTKNAQKLGLTQQRLEQIALKDRSLFLHQENQMSLKCININMFCDVHGEFAISILLPMGFSLFTFYILRHYEFKILDIRDSILSLFSSIKTTNGLLPDFWSEHSWSFTKIIGFIGYWIYIPGEPPIEMSGIRCIGSALYIRTFGTYIGPPAGYSINDNL